MGPSSVFAQSLAITNARIVTVSGAPIEKGTIVIRDGLIQSVGTDIKPPADAKVIDGTGLTVYPGFIDAYSYLGLPAPAPRPSPSPGGGAAFLAAQMQQQAQPSNSNYPAGLRPEEMVVDDIRAGNDQFEANRAAGFTTALVVGRTGIFNGQSVLIDLAGESVSKMAVKSPVALHITFATIPGTYPGSLLGTFAALRQMFNDARRLDEWKKAYAANPKGIQRPESDRSLEALIPVVKGEVPVVFNANRQNEIDRALNLAKEYNLKAIIAGGQEAGQFVNRLKAQGVSVLLNANYPRRTTAASPEADPEPLETLRFRAEVPKTAAKLAAAGVKFAIYSGGANNLQDVFLNLGKSIESGLSREQAIRALTLNAAEIFGVADRTGTIEQGKIANLTIVKGDLFSRDKTVTHVFIDGMLFEPKAPTRPEGPMRPQNPNGSPNAAVNYSGSYSITIQAPGQSLTGTLVLNQQGNTLTGTLTTELGTVQIKDGRAGADGISFSGTAEVGGQAVEFSVRATISGNQLSGTVSSPQGNLPITGTKIP